MKCTVLFFLLLATFAANAQEPVCKDVTAIAASEAAAHRKMLAKNTSVLSLASGNYTVGYYRCEWAIDPGVYFITGKVTPFFVITATTNNLVFDLSTAMQVDSIMLRKKKLSFIQSSNQTVTIQLPVTYNAGKKDSLSIYYKGRPVGSGFGSFIQSTHNGTPVIWTLSEPYGARDWWPCRNGLDDKADSLDIFITHPAKYKASSNGFPVSTVIQNQSAVTHYKHRYPVASYLVALAVTNFSVFTDNVQLGDISLPVISYVYPEDSALFHNSNYMLLNAMRLFNKRFVRYPFINERYGQTQFAWGGGMEHQTNSFVTYPGENLMAHELAHQWFGDRITCGSWQDIWLNEGFATFCADFLYTETFHPENLATSVQSNLDFIVSSRGGSVKVSDTTNIGTIFDSRLSYAKGAFLLRMLRWTMGDTIFSKGIRAYLNDPALRYGFARTADLQRHLEAVSGLDLAYFFNQWYAGQGYPSFTVQWSQDASNTASINISQTTSHNSVNFFRVPLALTFRNATQEKTIIVDHTVNNQALTASIGFKADNMLIDPDRYIISRNNKVIKTAASNNIAKLTDVSPNPFTGTISFSVPGTTGKKGVAAVYDLQGNIIASKSIPVLQGRQSIDVPSAIRPGTYMLRVTIDGKWLTHIVIKK